MAEERYPHFICIDATDINGCKSGEEVILTDPYVDDYTVEIMAGGKRIFICEYVFRTHFKEIQSYDWNQYLAADNRECRFYLIKLMEAVDTSEGWYSIFNVSDYKEKYFSTSFIAKCGLDGELYRIEMGMEESRLKELIKKKMIIMPYSSPFKSKIKRQDIGKAI